MDDREWKSLPDFRRLDRNSHLIVGEGNEIVGERLVDGTILPMKDGRVRGIW